MIADLSIKCCELLEKDDGDLHRCKSCSVIPERVRGCWGPGVDCKSFTFISP